MEFYFHVNPPEQRGAKRDKKSRATFAGVITMNPDQTVINLRIGMSYCHSVDQFARRTGRIKAKGNALSQHPVQVLDISNINERDRNDYFVQQCRQYCDNNGINHNYQRRKKNKKTGMIEFASF